jgi:biotin carboxyl carrier protein
MRASVAERSYEVTIGERRLTVTLRQDDDTLFARIDDGEERPVELAQVSGALFALADGPARHELLARNEGNTVDIVLDGDNLQAEVVDALRARLSQVAGAGAAAHARRELKAPMPGLVVRVACQPGDAVAPGQPLVVLQAMKMENELSLPTGGTVASVAVGDGQTVDQGQVLLVVE